MNKEHKVGQHTEFIEIESELIVKFENIEIDF
jgi:hypothetical protein